MARNAGNFPQLPEAAPCLRLPLQAVLVAWVAWAGGILDPRRGGARHAQIGP